MNIYAPALFACMIIAVVSQATPPKPQSLKQPEYVELIEMNLENHPRLTDGYSDTLTTSLLETKSLLDPQDDFKVTKSMLIQRPSTPARPTLIQVIKACFSCFIPRPEPVTNPYNIFEEPRE